MTAGRLVVVGSGRIGLSLAADLSREGPFDGVTVAGPAGDRPPFLAPRPEVGYLPLEGAGRRPPTTALADLAPPGAAGCVLLFCVPDDRLAGAARTWSAVARRGSTSPVRVALHTSGFHPGEVLAPLRDAGASVGGWHPLVALPAPRTGAFRGIAVGVEGDREAVVVAERIAAAVGARPLRVEADRKARYHAAAVFGSNYLLACLAVALRELRRSARGDAGIRDLLPLARSALDGIGEELADAVTGPLARGDVGTVRGHLNALDPAAASLYRALAAELLALVGERLPLATRGELERLLEGADAEGADH